MQMIWKQQTLTSKIFFKTIDFLFKSIYNIIIVTSVAPTTSTTNGLLFEDEE